jgi:hypothetical protein
LEDLRVDYAQAFQSACAHTLTEIGVTRELS